MDDPVAEPSGPDLGTIRQERQREIHRSKNAADLIFLSGLLAGGPLASFDIQFTLGLVLMLGGGVASVLIRYASFSAAGALLTGILGALTLVSAVFDPSDPGDEADNDTREVSRSAYVRELARQYESEGIVVEARGSSAVTVWFYPPAVLDTPCGTFPDEATRQHLAELGFLRVVVNIRSEGQGLCSFHP